MMVKHHAEPPRTRVHGPRRWPAGSDLDLLAGFNSEGTLRDELGLRPELTDLLSIPLDVIATDTLNDELRRWALAHYEPRRSEAYKSGGTAGVHAQERDKSREHARMHYACIACSLVACPPKSSKSETSQQRMYRS